MTSNITFQCSREGKISELFACVNVLQQEEKINKLFHSPSPCELNISCTSTTAESRAKIWYQQNAFKPPVA